MAINLTTLATSALAFAVALAWNEAVNKTVKSLSPPRDEKAAARSTLIYAIIVTILVIFVVAIINRTQKLIHEHLIRGRPRKA